MKMFKDRQSAGKLLSNRLKHLFHDRGAIVLGVPRGGVVVAKEVANQLNLPLDILVTRKIGAPFQKELALGAVDPDGEVVGEVGEVGEIVEQELEELKRRENLYRQGKNPLDVENKIVILVDDGIATGATTLAAINYLKRHGAKQIILAVPVASQNAIEKMVGELGEVGEVIVLETPADFQSVGQFYQEFGEVTDGEVVQYLKE